MNIYEEYGFSDHDFKKLFVPIYDIKPDYKKHLPLLSKYDEFSKTDEKKYPESYSSNVSFIYCVRRL